MDRFIIELEKDFTFPYHMRQGDTKNVDGRKIERQVKRNVTMKEAA